MREFIELHPFIADEQGQKKLAVRVLGTPIHEVKLEDRGHPWWPVYARYPKFGGDEVRFNGGPIIDPGEYSPLVARLDMVLPATPCLTLLEMRNTELMPGMMRDPGGAYSKYGGLMLENVAEVIGDVMGTFVEIRGDPQAFEIADLHADIHDHNEAAQYDDFFGRGDSDLWI